MKFIFIRLKNVFKILIIILLFSIIGTMLFLSESDKSIETFSIPTANKIIVIDPGHGGIDAGASSGDLKEKDINLDIALRLQKLIEANEGIAVLSRTEDVSTADKNRAKTLTQKKSDLIERRNMIEKHNADVFVSLHMNKFGDKKYKGAQVFYSDNEESKKLAEIMQNQFKNIMDNTNNRKIKNGNNIFVLKNNKIPSVLIECGFLSNESELKNFESDIYRQKVAWTIFVGLNEYLKE